MQKLRNFYCVHVFLGAFRDSSLTMTLRFLLDDDQHVTSYGIL